MEGGEKIMEPNINSHPLTCVQLALAADLLNSVEQFTDVRKAKHAPFTLTNPNNFPFVQLSGGSNGGIYSIEEAYTFFTL